LRNSLGIGAGIGGGDRHSRRRDLGILRDRQREDRDRADDDRDDRQHGREDGALYEKMGELH